MRRERHESFGRMKNLRLLPGHRSKETCAVSAQRIDVLKEDITQFDD